MGPKINSIVDNVMTVGHAAVTLGWVLVRSQDPGRSEEKIDDDR